MSCRAHGVSCPGGMWDLPGPGIERTSPALAGRFSTTRPWKKSTVVLFIKQKATKTLNVHWWTSYFTLFITAPPPLPHRFTEMYWHTSLYKMQGAQPNDWIYIDYEMMTRIGLVIIHYHLLILHQQTKKFFSLWWELLGFILLTFILTYSGVTFIMLYIMFLVFIYLLTGGLHLFTI